MKTKPILITSVLALALTTASAHADSFGSGGNTFNLGFVTITNPGNANDTTGYGGVSYNYNMAVTDVSQTMLDDATALGVVNLGGGGWTGNKPATNVTWYQAAAFVNWLNTSTGHQAAYQLNVNNTALTLWSPAQAWQAGGQNLFRNANAHYFLPSENEWYKAAYYDPNHGGPGVGGYWLFGTGSNTPPTAVASGTTPGTTVWGGQDGPAAVDQSGGLSPYGTQGQTGNVYQWMETDFADPTNSSDGNRVFRGGYWQTTTVAQRSDFRLQISPSSFAGYTGFRVASVPEPASAALLGLGTLLLTTRRRSA